MIYLLVNHIPFGEGSTAAEFRVGDAMLEDLRAQAGALAEVGGKLMVAAPFLPKLTSAAAHSFGISQFTPDAEGFEYFPLPYYITIGQYWRVKQPLIAALRQIISVADVVQMDYGGHPLMLGELAWHIAGELGKRRIWVFDGVDPFPRFAAEVRVTRNPLRRALRARRLRRKLDFCRKALGEADAVFALNESVVRRFRAVWDESRCHQFTQPMITDSVLLSPEELARAMARRCDRRRPLRVLCSGKQAPARGTEHAIRALAHCRRLSSDVKLTIAGPGSDRAGLEELVGGLAMGEHVRFVDSAVSTAGMLNLLAEHDVLLMTNLIPEFDRQILLAMARGLAIVGYENTATDRLLEANDAGVVVPLENILLLAQALIDLQQNRGRLRELAENGHRLAASMTLQAVHRRRARIAAALLQPVG